MFVAHAMDVGTWLEKHESEPPRALSSHTWHRTTPRLRWAFPLRATVYCRNVSVAWWNSPFALVGSDLESRNFPSLQTCSDGKVDSAKPAVVAESGVLVRI